MTPFKHGPLLSDEHDEDGANDMLCNPPNWKDLIALPMAENCLAPSDEALGVAFDHYCDGLAAPFHARQADMAALYADILGGIADLQIIAPDLLDGVLSSDEEEAAQ